ncbi:MAG: SDR family oxidoreductase [Candidatus Nanopelagicales bacterium]|nr:SDR family oxidoreductase [Candidatus Nanopelagicales bacterium]
MPSTSSHGPLASLNGRNALVTGASRGIGRSIALALADNGAHVILVARNAELLESVKSEIESQGGTAQVIVADLSSDQAPEMIAQELQSDSLDILVNNAGGNSFMSPVQSMRFSGWKKTIQLNLDSVVGLTQALIPRLINSGHGSVINVSSVAGLNGSPFMSHYGAAKAALISFSRSLAVELASQGVRVNSLVPGWIETDLTDFLRGTKEAEAGALARVPMARWGRPEEIAAAALFLASDSSSFMTGQELIVDGGLSAMP